MGNRVAKASLKVGLRGAAQFVDESGLVVLHRSQ
jgi:hypothetical protein